MLHPYNASMKDFDSWNVKKKNIDKNQLFQHPKTGEIWWCRVGINVGSEIYGKGIDYVRPVLIINDEGDEGFIGVPLTSKIKNRKYACIIMEDDGTLATALVYQIKSFDKRRLVENHSTLSSEYFNRVLDIIRVLIGKNLTTL